MQRWKFLLFEILLALMVLVPHAVIVTRPDSSVARWFTKDDSYYYFKVAENIAEGHGITFDGISQANGFHPLWMLLCIPVFSLAHINPILPFRVLIMLLAILNAATGVMLFRLVHKVISFAAGAVVAITWVLLPFIHGVTTQLGMESGVSALCMVVLLNLVWDYLNNPPPSNRSVIWIGVAAALTLYSRLDNIYLVGILGAWLVLRRLKLPRLMAGDLFLAGAIPLAAYIIRIEAAHLTYAYTKPAYLLVLLALVVRPVLNFLFGLYRENGEALWRRALRCCGAVLAGSAMLNGMMYVLTRLNTFPAGWPRATILIEAVLSPVLFTAWHLLARSGESSPLEGWAQARSWLRTNWDHLWPVGLRYFGILGAALGAFVLFSLIAFHTPMPVSGQIKQWWGTLPNTVYGFKDTLITFLGITNDNNLGAWALASSTFMIANQDMIKLLHLGTTSPIPTILLGAAILVPIGLSFQSARKNGARLLILPVFIACFVQFAGYKATGYLGTRPWYWVTEMLCLALLGAVWVQALFDLLQRVHVPYLAWGVTAIVAVLLFSANYRRLNGLVPAYDVAALTNTPDGVTLLEQATKPGDVIGSTGGGKVAYYIHDRRIINLDGLMNSPRYFELMKECRASEYLDEIGLQYVLGAGYMVTQSDPYKCNIATHLKYLETLGNTGLFAYIPGKQ
jgi:hypothetical protein